ncbi:MAG TPA: DedA family protein [Candidatus Paceibacterota bacterium]|nr:DedA family protein [Candidatus Paceibacterota bacterium]
MDYVLSILLSYLLLYKYVTLFIVMYVAGLLIPFPINTLVFAAGVFASQGFLNLWASFGVAILGNVLGDYTGYMLTAIWKHRYIKRSHLEKIPYLPKLEAYLREYAGLTVFFSRFLGIAGCTVNFLSGLAGVPMKRFLTFDILGNAFSAGIFLFGGYILGTFTETFSDSMSLIGLMISLTFIIIVVLKSIQRK